MDRAEQQLSIVDDGALYQLAWTWGAGALRTRWKLIGVGRRMCGKVCGGASVKVEDENGALERHQPTILPLPASHLPRAAPLPQPFWAAHAPDGRKGLLRMLEEDDVLPSHASAAVLVGRGLWRRWAHGGRESDLPL